MPPDLTYDEYVQVALNVDRVKWRQVDVHVQGARIAQGQTPPLGYLETIIGDTDKARQLYTDHILSSMMRRR